MNRTRSAAAVSVMLLLVLAGCSSKKESATQAPAQSKEQAQAQVPAQAQPQNVAPASPRDEADATPVRDKVLAHVKKGEFASIYREASPGFREVGPEQKFMELWNRQLADTGPFKDAKQVSHSVRPQDKFQVFVYNVQYEKKQKQLRLTFGRSKKGVFELTGINQTDIKEKG